MNIPFCSAISNVSKRLGALKVVVLAAKIEPITLQGFESDLLEIIGARIDSDGPVAWLKWQDLPVRSDDGPELDLTRVAREYTQLAKTFGLIDSGNSLRESAIPLRSYIERRHPDSMSLWRQHKLNPLLLDEFGGMGEKALFWQILFTGDVLTCAFPYILSQRDITEYDPNREFFDDKQPFDAGEKPHKLEEVDRNLMLDAFGVVRNAFNEDLWSEVENLDELKGYAERMRKWTSFRHHVPPRLEWLVDVGLLKHNGAVASGPDHVLGHAYTILEPCRRAGKYLEQHLLKNFACDRFVHFRLFSFLNEVYGLEAKNPASDEEVFRYLALGYHFVARDLGDTPAKSAALMGAILALEQGVLINLSKMYEVGRKPPPACAQMIEYSGGSRLDDEFMFSIRPKALKGLLAGENRGAQ
jgi:hypothetical protein